MKAGSVKRIERSVDSLQKIYAVVIALAIGQAIETLLLDRKTDVLASASDVLARTPIFFSFVLILVPFYHGMNRHLDACYIERPQGQRVEGALLFDFLVFFIESALLFAVANSVSPTIEGFIFLGLLLGVDVVWALVSHWIHYTGISPSILRWSTINGVVVALGLFIGLNSNYSDMAKGWLFLVLAASRSLADYLSCWEFYFPKDQSVSA
jgi:hypothetical protein